MHEYVTVSSSSYDPASLASKLTEKSGDGWTVVAIVPTGGDVTAFLSRETSGSGSSSATRSSTTVTVTETPAAVIDSGDVPAVQAAEPAPHIVEVAQAPEPVAEPAGWAVAPEATPAAATATQTGVVTPGAQSAPAAATQPQAVAPVAVAPAAVAPVAVAPAAATPAPAAVAPAVPAGWYADPAGRFELRYWDGGTWTEHVSRAGQQFTDPPVA